MPSASHIAGIRAALKARKHFVKAAKKLEALYAEEDLQILLKKELYSIVTEGEFAGQLNIEVITHLYLAIARGEKSANKAQMAAIQRLFDQYLGRGKVATEQRDTADAGAPKVLYIGGKQEPKTLPVQVVPTLEDGDVSGNSEQREGE
jgi:hypothetical protein